MSNDSLNFVQEYNSGALPCVWDCKGLGWWSKFLKDKFLFGSRGAGHRGCRRKGLPQDTPTRKLRKEDHKCRPDGATCSTVRTIAALGRPSGCSRNSYNYITNFAESSNQCLPDSIGLSRTIEAHYVKGLSACRPTSSNPRTTESSNSSRCFWSSCWGTKSQCTEWSWPLWTLSWWKIPNPSHLGDPQAWPLPSDQRQLRPSSIQYSCPGVPSWMIDDTAAYSISCWKPRRPLIGSKVDHLVEVPTWNRRMSIGFLLPRRVLPSLLDFELYSQGIMVVLNMPVKGMRI